MATKSWYLTATTANSWRTIDEATQSAANNSDGWVVSTGSTNNSEFFVGVERAATTFSGSTVPDGSLDTTNFDAFRTTNKYRGTFASATWDFHFVVRGVTSANSQAGACVFRLFKGANADGTGATEITSAQQTASTVTITATGTDFDSALATLNPGAIALNDQYLFIQIAWKRTGAGSMTTNDVNWRTGSSSSAGTRVTSADFVDANIAAGVSGGSTLTASLTTGIRLNAGVSGSSAITLRWPPIQLSADVRGMSCVCAYLRGNALRFTGDHDGLYTTSLASHAPNTQTVIIGMRYRTSRTTGPQMSGVDMDNPTGGTPHYWLIPETEALGNRTGSHDDVNTGFLFTAAIAANTWALIAETNSFSNSRTNLYWAIESAQGALPALSETDLNPTNIHPSFTDFTRFIVGTDDAHGDGFPQNEWLDGDIDFIKIFNIEMTAAQLARECKQKAPTEEFAANLVAFYGIAGTEGASAFKTLKRGTWGNLNEIAGVYGFPSGTNARTLRTDGINLPWIQNELIAAVTSGSAVTADLTTNPGFHGDVTTGSTITASLTTGIQLVASVSGSSALASRILPNAVGAVRFVMPDEMYDYTTPPTGTGPYTMTAWVRVVTSADSPILGLLNSDISVWWQFETHAAGLSINSSSGGLVSAGSLDPGLTNTWLFVALMHDGSSDRYAWGKEGELLHFGATAINAPSMTSYRSFIGMAFGASTVEFADVKWWEAKLSDAEVQTEAYKQNPVKTSPHSDYYMKSDATLTTDYSGNGRTATDESGRAHTDVTGPRIDAAPDTGMSAGVSGSSALTAALTTAIRCVASVSGSSVLTADLLVPKPLNAAVATSSALTASLTTAISCTAAVAGSSALSAPLTTGIACVATVAGSSVVTGSLTTAIRLNAAVSTSSTLTASLTTAIQCVASVSGSSTETASLTTGIQLVASVSGSSTLNNPVLAGVAAALAANVTTSSALTAALTTGIQCAASVSGSSTETAALTTAIQCVAAVSTSTALTAAMTTAIRLSASVSTSSTLAAPLTTGISLVASVAGSSTETASLTTAIRLAADVTINPNLAGALTTAIQCAASVSGSSALTAAVTTGIACAAAVTGSSALTANLSVPKPLDAALTTSSVLTASLTTQIQLVASVSTTSTLTADLLVPKPLSASVSGSSAATASLTTAIQCSASVSGSSALDCTLAGTAAALAGNVTTSSTLSAALTTQIQCTASVATSSSVAADLTTGIACAASLSGSSVLTADLTVGSGLFADVTTGSVLVAPLTTEIRCVAAVSGSSALTADLSTGAGIALNASVSGSTTLGAALTTQIRLAGNVTQSKSTLSAGTLQTAIRCTASVATSSTLTCAAPATQIRCAASVSSSSVLNAPLTTAIQLGASLAESSTLSADLSTGFNFSAALVGSSTLSAPVLSTQIRLRANSTWSSELEAALFTTTQFPLAEAVIEVVEDGYVLSADEGATVEVDDEGDLYVAVSDDRR